MNQSSLILDLCQLLTRLTRQMLESDQCKTQTHVLGRGNIYRITVELTPVPPELIDDMHPPSLAFVDSRLGSVLTY